MRLGRGGQGSICEYSAEKEVKHIAISKNRSALLR